MKSLLHLEYRRLFRTKSFYVGLAVSFVLLLITALTSKAMYEMVSETDAANSFAMIGIAKPTVLGTIKGFGGTNFTYIAAIFVAIFVAEDFTSDTIKNIYAKGLSRVSVCIAKYVSSLSACLLYIGANLFFSFAIAEVLGFEQGTAGENYIGSILTAVLILIAYHAVFFLISVTIRKTGGAIALSIFGPMIVGLILSLIDLALRLDDVTIASYWITGQLSTMAGTDVETTDIVASLIISGVLIGGCFALSLFANRKREN